MNHEFLPDQYVRVGEINTRYWSMGDSGNPVLLIHGFGCSVEIWQHNISALAEHHRVYAIDLVGFGRSDKPTGPYSLSMITDFVDGFMKAMDINKASLIGLSLGGGISLKYALQYPHKVDKLVLVDSAGLGKEMILSMRLMSLPILGEMMTKPSRKMTYLFFKPAVLQSRILKGEFTDTYYELFSLPGAQKSLLKVLRSICTICGPKKDAILPIMSNLHKISAATLILWGREDAIVPLKHGYYGKEKIPTSELHVCEDCGHMPNFEKPYEFNRIVLEFLSR